MPFKIIRNDIITMTVDAIVNTANPCPIIGGGVDYAIHHAAGHELLKARQEIGSISVGEAFITDAYKLPAKHVIHTVGPVWQGGSNHERDSLRKCYLSSLQLAFDNHCESIAFPLISAGIFGCPADIAIETAVQAISSFLMHKDMQVYLVIFDKNAFQISGHLFQDIQAFINEKYVQEKLDEEYRIDGPDSSQRRRNDAIIQASAAEPMDLAEERYDVPLWLPVKKAKSKERTLQDLIDESDATFSESLLHIIDSKGLKDPDVYKRANIDRKLFSKIRNNPQYQPRKETALAFAIALELNLDETKDFIGRAGFALTHSSKRDIIIEYFIEKKDYDIFTINETLFAFDQPLLGC